MALKPGIEMTESPFATLLSKIPVGKCEMLFHQLINLFCGQKAPSYESYSEIWSLYEWWDLIEESEKFLKTTAGKDFDIPKYLTSLTDEYQSTVTNSLKIRSKDIRNALSEKSHNISGAYLKNFDWKLQMTLASDKLAQINEPRLLLSLNIEDKGELSPLHLDLSMEELKSLITTLEEANKEVITLKTLNPEDISIP